jgi:hypothetical protein
MNRIIGNMFIKVVKEVSLLSYIKEHFNIWETDFQDINYIYICICIYMTSVTNSSLFDEASEKGTSENNTI